jgi:hypothetical protein
MKGCIRRRGANHHKNNHINRRAIRQKKSGTFELVRRPGATYISMKEIAMFKVAVVAFAFAVSGFMLWIAHEDANYAQRPHAAFVKRAA